MSTASSRERDRANLKDLAKMAGMTPPPSGVFAGTQPTRDSTPDREENSGVINLAALAAGEATADEASAATPRPALVASAAAALPALSAEAMSTMRSAGAPAKSEKKPGRWLALGGLLSAAAIAAGVFFGMHRAQTSSSPAVALGTPPPAETAAKPGAASPVVPPAPGAPDDHGVDPSTLPAAGAHPTGLPAGPLAANPAIPPAPKPAPAVAPTTDPALVANIPTATATATASDRSLQTLMQQAAGVTSSPTASAAATADSTLPAPGSVPLKPSMGAIQGALGAALPSARACLGPDDPVSHATVTFRSDGTVGSVSISGGAAGKPAEACIRAALMNARVAPFAQPTFTAPATVRPN
ncbi:MAG TPA: hypothetical protein VIF09_06750 [Polyangiaceae bacterium]